MTDHRSLGTTRREALGRLAAFAAAGAAGLAAVPARAPAQPASGAIDVHYHVAPPSWLAAQGGTVDEGRVFRGWSIEHALAQMDAEGVATGYASITVPGKRFDDPVMARAMSRECNEYMAAQRSAHPGRFGMFALLPLPDLDGSLAEVAYAYDTLKTDGIGLYTSYGTKYLGDPVFDPLFAELNRRNAVVFVHPVVSPCCTAVQPWLPAAAIEYGTDTTRAIAAYVFNGYTQRYPNVRVIWSHAGGTMPYLVERFINQGNENLKARVPDGFLAEAQKMYYDTAQIPSRGAMEALRAIVPVSQIVFGTDYPYRTFAWTQQLLTDGKAFNAKEMQAVLRGNAGKLL